MTATAVVVAVFAALLVSLPITLWANSQTASAARNSAQFNCTTLKDIAVIMGAGDPTDPQLKRGGFVSTDAYLREREQALTQHLKNLNPGAVSALLADPEYKKITGQAQGLESGTTAYWSSVLIPRLQAEARQNCAALG